MAEVQKSRWPAAMRTSQAAEYLDVCDRQFRKIADGGAIPSFQYTERGDRYYAKEDLDAFIESRRRASVA